MSRCFTLLLDSDISDRFERLTSAFISYTAHYVSELFMVSYLNEA